MKTFGEVVAETRRARGLTQKALAARLKKKDGASNRRNQPAPHFVAQLAEVLAVPHDVLRFYAQRLDEEVLPQQDDPPSERIVAAYVVFKRELRGEPRC